MGNPNSIGGGRVDFDLVNHYGWQTPENKPQPSAPETAPAPAPTPVSETAPAPAPAPEPAPAPQPEANPSPVPTIPEGVTLPGWPQEQPTSGPQEETLDSFINDSPAPKTTEEHGEFTKEPEPEYEEYEEPLEYYEEPEEQPKEHSIWDEVDQAPAGQTANTQQNDTSDDEFDFHKRKTAGAEKTEDSKDSPFDSFFVENEPETPKTNPTPEAHAPTSERTGETPRETAQGRGENAEKNHLIKENWEKTPKSVKAAIVGGGLTGLAIVGALSSLITNIVNGGKKTETIATPPPAANEQSSEEDVDESEVEKDWKELTGIDEFDQSVDGTFDQSGDIGMNKTETKSEDNPDGKFSDNSMAAPNTLMREYFDTDMEHATLEQKGMGVEFASYKQAETAAAILTQVKAKGFENMSYIRAVEKIKGASDEQRAEYQDMLKEIFENSELGETTVGEIRDALRVAGQDETLADWHYYMNRATGKAELRNIPTGAETKVLSFKYTEKSGTESTFYFLERCYNGFQVRKIVNSTTKEVTYEITVFEYEDKLDKKNAEAEKKNMGNEHTDERKIDEKVTPKTTEQEDRQGFKEIEEQKKADEEKARQDEAERQRQQEAERQAAAEAERVAAEQADREAQERAAAEAAEEQRQANEEQKRKAAEEEAAKKAQEEADRKAAEEKKAAEEASKNDEQRDANDFNNTDDFKLKQ